MKCAFAILLFTACPLLCQVTVQSGKSIEIPAADATSAVSLDLHVADASLANGFLTVKGIDPGDTLIVVIAPNVTREIPVHISAGAPAYPPGFVAPQELRNQSGNYEFRFSSDRLQVENTLDLHTQDGGNITQFHIVSATLAGGPDRTTFVPSVYYRFAAPDADITFLDQTVNESPLTLQNVILRGFHMKKGGWKFHAGYTASAAFADVFLPADKEFAAGVSNTIALGKFLSVSPGIYFLRSIDLTNGQESSGLISSLDFHLKALKNWQVGGELAYGRSIAFDGELQHDSDHTKIGARMIQRKLEFPSLRSSSLPGLSGDASWTQLFTARLSLISNASINDVDLRSVRQNSRSASTYVRYKFSRSWSLGSGANYGLFTTTNFSPARTFTLPQQINFDRPHFGAGFEYEISTASDSFSNGSGFRQTIRINRGRFQIGQYVDWQKDALSISSLFSQLPGLQQALQQLGITAVTPDQLSALLQDAAFLQSLGLSSFAQVVTVPRRLQEGGNVTWISGGARPHQLSISFIASRNQFATSSSTDYNFTGSYAKEISAKNQLQMNWSAVRSGTLAGRERFSPLVSLSLRHAFSYSPPISPLDRSTNISGVVFVDSLRKGVYEVGMNPIPQATVILDGEKAVLTDALGHFDFNGIAVGDHRIQLQYHDEREYYFTRPPDAIVAGGSQIDFGIAFPQNDLWGYVQDDAGNGMADIKLQITNDARVTTTTTDSSGKFDLQNPEPGDYRIEVDPESVAFGYTTEELSPAEVHFTGEASAHTILKIPAVRVLTGEVSVYNATSGAYVPVRGVTVTIPKLDRTAITNAAGRYVIASLPTGDFEVRLAAGQASLVRTISVPVHPVTLRNDFRISSLNGQIASMTGGQSE